MEGIERLIHLNTGKWICVSREVDEYRRRPLPSYLLHKQSSSVALYLAQSTLSLAFCETTTIHFNVDLIGYSK
jgi:phosphatidylinositol-4,5-bisphosphate 3-kinase